MKVLVTGGTGFIGRALCASLIEAGHIPTVLTRSTEKAARVLGSSVTAVERLEQAASPDAVVNLIGENLGSGRWNDERKRDLWTSRVNATRLLVAWMRGLPTAPRTLISASAIGYYGAHEDEEISEDTPAGDGFGAKLCEAWEQEASSAETLGMRVCRLRIGLVLARGGGPLAKLLPAYRLGLGGPLGSGEQYVSWIHRADLVALIVRTLEDATLQGPVNATAPNPVTNDEFSRTLGRVLHRPAFFRVPAVALRMALGEMSGLLLTGQRVRPSRALAAGFEFRYPALEVALREVLA